VEELTAKLNVQTEKRAEAEAWAEELELQMSEMVNEHSVTVNSLENEVESLEANVERMMKAHRSAIKKLEKKMARVEGSYIRSKDRVKKLEKTINQINKTLVSQAEQTDKLLANAEAESANVLEEARTMKREAGELVRQIRTDMVQRLRDERIFYDKKMSTQNEKYRVSLEKRNQSYANATTAQKMKHDAAIKKITESYENDLAAINLRNEAALDKARESHQDVLGAIEKTIKNKRKVRPLLCSNPCRTELTQEFCPSYSLRRMIKK
jgi:ElaB/YqjD/DUF883 family membrane-anchored ribosome-binding protein